MKRQCSGVKHIFKYLKGTIDMRLFCSSKFKLEMIGYENAGYFFDPHKTQSQTCYLFTY